MSIRLQFHRAGFAELRTSAFAEAEVKKLAERTLERANSVSSTTDPAATEPYYELQDGSDARRARYRVRTASRRAARHEAKTQALQKAL